ncbi:MAG: 16S rRNA (guanine(966)-N(2))-methyltransferase RsmD [Verrucomicrobiota bacterium]
MTRRLRIVAGSAGGLWIQIPKKFKSRPTPDRVKQAIFSSLGESIVHAKALDLFAGTGNLGIEALSRGAQSCVFVESDAEHAKFIKENLTLCHFSEKGRVIAQSVEDFLTHSTLNDFKIVFLDPPYAKDTTDLSTTSLAHQLAEKLFPSTLIVWEHFHKNIWNPHPRLEVLKHPIYGDTGVLFLSVR